jgi:dynein heavy chain
VRQSCMAEYEVALPDLHQAEAALRKLDRSDMTELKSMRKPPPNVKVVMAAVCVMLGEPPTVVTEGGRSKRDYWPTGQKLLGDRDLVARLARYDRDAISPDIMTQIRNEFLILENFRPAVVRHSSRAAEGMCAWVCAMSKYNEVDLLLRPKKAALAEAERGLEERREVLAQRPNLNPSPSPNSSPNPNPNCTGGVGPAGGRPPGCR